MVLRWIVLEKLQLLVQLRPSPRLEKHVALQLWTNIYRFKFGGDGDPVEASFAVTLPVLIGDAKTWIEAFVVPGSTPHLISRRWLSQHRCVVNFDPNNLCLESPEFGSVPLVLHSSGHLLLSLVNPSTRWTNSLS